MKVCEICQSEFEETRKTQQYCKECGKNTARAREHYKKAEIINRLNAGDFYKVKEITCIECGKTILTTYDRRFCSQACQESHAIKTAKCPVCRVLLTDVGIESVKDKACSDKCRETAKIERAIQAGNYVPCQTCGELFARKSYSNIFCSKKCFVEDLNKKREIKDAEPVIKKDRTEERLCEWCQKPFVWRPRNASQRFCSDSCRKEKNKHDKQAEQSKLKLGEELHICTTCRTSQSDCERFTSKFVYSPKGSVMKKIGNKYIIVSCPKFKP